MSQPAWGTAPEPASGAQSTQSPATWGTDEQQSYAVVIEQTVGSGEGMRWAIEPEPWLLDHGTSRDQARALLRDLAETFRPQHPWSPQSRQVLQISPDSYLVYVVGATKSFHMRLTLTVRL